MNYIVSAITWQNQQGYITPELRFTKTLGDNCLWSGDYWTPETIRKEIKTDAQNHYYDYSIEEI